NTAYYMFHTVNHSQFWKCVRGILRAYAGCGCGNSGVTITVNNCLMGYVTYPITTPSVLNSYCYLRSCTFDHATTLLSGWTGTTVRATNSIFSSVSGWGWTLGGDHNGF